MPTSEYLLVVHFGVMDSRAVLEYQRFISETIRTYSEGDETYETDLDAFRALKGPLVEYQSQDMHLERRVTWVSSFDMPP